MTLLEAVKEKLYEEHYPHEQSIEHKHIVKTKTIGELLQLFYEPVVQILSSMEVEKFWFK